MDKRLYQNIIATITYFDVNDLPLTSFEIIGLADLSVIFRGPGPGPAERPEPPLALADAGRAQDVVSMTMVSQETGLQIVWFLDKNFDYEGVNK